MCVLAALMRQAWQKHLEIYRATFHGSIMALSSNSAVRDRAMAVCKAGSPRAMLLLPAPRRLRVMGAIHGSLPSTATRMAPQHLMWNQARGLSQAAGAAGRTAAAAAQAAYGAEQIQVLEGLEPVRKRPGMYIGSTGPRGLHHLLWEVLDNAVDEVQAGHANAVDVSVDLATATVSVADNGRGIPTDVHPTTGVSALETVLTVLHAGGKFGDNGDGDGSSSGYRVSGGLHGVGISVVNALSDKLTVQVVRGGVLYSQTFSRGVPTSSLQQQQPVPPGFSSSGTKVTFTPDASVFAPGVAFDADTIVSRLRELAFLNSSATLRLQLTRDGVSVPVPGAPPPPPPLTPSAAADSSSGGSSTETGVAVQQQGGKKQKQQGRGSTAAKDTTQQQPAADQGWAVFHAEAGLQEYVEWLNRDNVPLHQPATCSGASEGVEVELALQWVSDAFTDTLVGFANSIKTIDGGSHMDGLRAALTRLVNAAARKAKLLKDGDPSLSGEHVREGLAGVISVKVPSPEFEGQTKTRLGNPEVRRLVDSVVSDGLGAWLESHPAALSAIVSKALTAARAAEAARKARELVRRKHVLTRSTLPGKLADCTSSKREETEIFLVEGDSAGGSAKQARDRNTQAVLPLRGKILNVERRDDAALYKNQEISALIIALGLGTKGGSSSPSGVEEDPLKGLRYGKVVLLTDADVDGAHIRTLLLTFLFRYKRELFEDGRVYVAVPPLYRVDPGRGAQPLWAYDDAGLAAALEGLRGSGGGGGGGSGRKGADRRSSSSSRGGSAAVAATEDTPTDAEQQLVGNDSSSSSSNANGGGGSSSSLAALPPGVSVTRFKGLGEMMPEQLWATTLNPSTRVLRRLTLEDAAKATHTFVQLMGVRVAPRRALIEAEGARYTLEQLDV